AVTSAQAELWRVCPSYARQIQASRRRPMDRRLRGGPPVVISLRASRRAGRVDLHGSKQESRREARPKKLRRDEQEEGERRQAEVQVREDEAAQHQAELQLERERLKHE